MKKNSKKNTKTQWGNRLNLYISTEMMDFVTRKKDDLETTRCGYVRQLLKAEMQKELDQTS